MAEHGSIIWILAWRMLPRIAKLDLIKKTRNLLVHISTLQSNMALSADEIAYQTAHIHESRRVNIVAAISVLCVLSTSALLLRVYVRLTTRVGFEADDYTIFAAGVSFSPSDLVRTRS